LPGRLDELTFSAASSTTRSAAGLIAAAIGDDAQDHEIVAKALTSGCGAVGGWFFRPVETGYEGVRKDARVSTGDGPAATESPMKGLEDARLQASVLDASAFEKAVVS
jgi:hypothetical protein